MGEPDRSAVSGGGAWRTTRLLLLARGVSILAAAVVVLLRLDSASALFSFIHLSIAALLLSVTSWSVVAHWRSALPYFRTVLARLIDICVVLWVIYLSGGPQSPFVFIFPLLILGAAMMLPRNTVLALSLIAGTLYVLLVGVLILGVLLPPWGGAVPVSPPGGVLLQLAGLLSAMVLVAITTSALRGEAQEERARVKETEQHLFNLGARQRELIEGVPEGIITARRDLTVTSINRVGEELLGVMGQSVVDQRLPSVLRLLCPGVMLPSPDEYDRFIQPLDLVISRSDGSSRSLSLTARYLGDQHEAPVLYVLKDVSALRAIEKKLQQQEEMARLLSEDGANSGPLASQGSIYFVGETDSMRQIATLIDKVAPSEATILVTGESGTGKELIARAVHGGSLRSNRPFVTVNCGAIPDSLLESELFGHKRGAFTGAVADHKGYFREADGGTLFLDEVGELPLPMQAKLLRALQERVVRPVGGDRDIEIDVRIIAATNRNLRSEVAGGTFREDLFYRLEVIHIALPPLRDRKDDIPLLVKRLIEHHRRGDKARPAPVISPTAMELLLNHDYPGNIRELENVLERALVLGGDVILPEHLPDALRAPRPASSHRASVSTEVTNLKTNRSPFPIDLEAILERLEKEYILAALKESGGSRKGASDLLGLNLRSLRYRLQKFGIQYADGND